MTANSILAMNWSMGFAEYIQDVRAAERKIERDLKRESDEICKAIHPFFSQEMWDAWVDAGPDDLLEFVLYARAEWYRIADEFEIDYSEDDGMDYGITGAQS